MMLEGDKLEEGEYLEGQNLAIVLLLLSTSYFVRSTLCSVANANPTFSSN